MLPAGSRLRSRADFTSTFRRSRGTRAHDLVVVHLAVSDATSDAEPPRAGLVVSRAVGPAVVRNRVKRRLRHLLASRLATLPPGAHLVVRALPAAGRAGSAELGQALDAALARAHGRIP